MSKIYISDLDGTLLRNNASISRYTAENLNILLKNNVHFTVASARSVKSIQKILIDIPLKLPVIEFNGAFISDLKTGKHEIINEISKKITQGILNIIKKCSKTPFISSFNGKEDCLYYNEISNNGMSWYVKNRIESKDERLREVTSLEDTLNDNIVCFTLIDKKEKLLGVFNELKASYPKQLQIYLIENQYAPGWHWLTVHDKRATKDQAIKVLLNKLNIGLENLTVFGDEINDIKMFEIASKSIAVENASKELKKYATEITGSNENDGVIKYIMKDLNY